MAGCTLHRHGGRHDLFLNPANGRKAPVPRHAGQVPAGSQIRHFERLAASVLLKNPGSGVGECSQSTNLKTLPVAA